MNIDDAFLRALNWRPSLLSWWRSPTRLDRTIRRLRETLMAATGAGIGALTSEAIDEVKHHKLPDAAAHGLIVLCMLSTTLLPTMLQWRRNILINRALRRQQRAEWEETFRRFGS